MALEATPRPRPSRCPTPAILAALVAFAAPAAGGPSSPAQPSALPSWQVEGRLLPVGDALGDRDDRYAEALAADGDTLAIGVPGRDLPDDDAGCVYLYERSAGAWSLTVRLDAPGASSFVIGFGSRLALDGDTLAVAAPGSWGQGRVYVYLRTAGTWTLQATLTPPLQASAFGEALSLSGDTLAVGAPEADTGFGVRSGAAFVYVRVAGAWALEQEVLGFEIAGDDRYGAAVALDGDRLAVGAPDDDPGTAIDAGSAYVFERSGGTWAQKVKLVDPLGTEWARFGQALALEAVTLAVGAPGQGDGRVHVYEDIAGVFIPRALLAASASGRGLFGRALALRGDELLVGVAGDYGTGTGSAEIFTRSGSSWSPGWPLLPADLASGDRYGAGVALATGTAAIGAPQHLDTGAAWVWTGSASTWTIEARLDNRGTASADGFGSALALDATTLVIGAPADDTSSGRDSGSVSVFERVGSAWALQQKIVPPPGTPGRWSSDGPAFGTSAALSADRLAVGAPSARGEGRVFVYVRSGGTWSLAAELAPSPSSSFAAFGTAVALRGTTLLVGAPEEESGTPTGVVYSFEEVAGTWALQEKVGSAFARGYGATLALAPSGMAALVGAPESNAVSLLQRSAAAWGSESGYSPATPGQVGAAVALTDGAGFVGAPEWPSGQGSTTGAVFVFAYSPGGLTWGNTLPAQTDEYGQRFGASVAAEGTLLAVGAPGNGRGAVHVFEAVDGVWTPSSVLSGAGAGWFPRFGSALAVHGGRLVVGEPGADTTAGLESGAASVFAPTSADLSVALDAPTSAAQGALLTARIHLTNSGPGPAAGVAFSVSSGQGLEPETWSLPSGTCTRAGVRLSCSLPAVPVGTFAVADIQMAAVAAGTWPVTAQLTTTDVDPSNDSATVSIAVNPSVADVALTLTGPPYARVGDTLHYSILLFNAGPGEAAGLTVDWAPSPGIILEDVSGCDPAACRIARLGVGSKWIGLQFRVPFGYQGPSPVVLSASVATLSQDPQPGNNQASVATPFVRPPSPLGFYTLAPCRLYDSRVPGRLPLLAGEVRVLTPRELGCGVPYGAGALALNVTVTGATAAGNVRVYPAWSPVPNASTVNFLSGQTRANNAVVGLSPEGDLSILATQASGTVHVVLDVVGFFE